MKLRPVVFLSALMLLGIAATAQQPDNRAGKERTALRKLVLLGTGSLAQRILGASDYAKGAGAQQ